MAQEPGEQARATFALVIPTHRRAQLVRQAVDSALRQSLPFDEVIVVADGADDPSVDALAAIRGIRVIAIEHRGVAGARNAGVEAATADWVCFLDDDDLLDPGYLAAVDAAVREVPDRRAVNTYFWTFAAPGDADAELTATDLDGCLSQAAAAHPRLDLSYLHIEGRSFDLLLERLRGSMSTAAVRRDVLVRAGGFPETLSCAEDWTMYVNVARLAEWHVIPRRLAYFREHASNATVTKWASNGVMTLRAIRSFWEPTSLPTPHRRPLTAYAPDYRFFVQLALEAARRSGDRDIRRQVLELAPEILPRRRDRIRARLPRGVRRILGRAARSVRRVAPGAQAG